MAKFGKQQCGYSQGGSGTFAEVYDEIRGRPVYQYYASDDMIHFADVSLEWMTDVSKVCLFDKMNGFLASGSGRLDVRDIVRPSVQDGYVDSNLRLLYSVCRMPDRRLTVGGEEYGPRCGIGVTLYRMLLSTAYDYELSQSGLMQQFFGYDPQAGFAPMTYAARYTLHDMNLGDDQSENIITSREPYYFSPSEYSSYKDEDGKGYHVIHFLENLAPYTGGWANLL
jgi:hypothetical protein